MNNVNLSTNPRQTQGGFSLVETLVAMVISIFLLGGVIQVYSANRTTYGFSEAVSRVQENGRFALDAIARDIRLAGFWGCATFDPADTRNITNNLDPNGAGFDEYYDFVNQPPVSGTDNDQLNNSDKIMIYGAAPGQTNVLPPYGPSTSANIKVNAIQSLEVDDIVLLTNCKGADIFQISNLTAGSGADQLAVVHNTGTGTPGNYNPNNCNSGQCLSQVYGGDAALMKLQKVTYTLEAGASGDTALFRAEFDQKAELVDGIEQIQFLYGVNEDTDNTTPDQYLTADNVADWQKVTAVKVMILVKAPAKVSMDKDQVVRFNGQNISFDDQFLRQSFSLTVALRNRI